MLNLTSEEVPPLRRLNSCLINKIWSYEEELEVKPEEGISLGVHYPKNMSVANSKVFIEMKGADPLGTVGTCRLCTFLKGQQHLSSSDMLPCNGDPILPDLSIIKEKPGT